MGPEDRAYQEGQALSQKAWLHGILQRIRGEPGELLPFHAVAQLRPSGEHYLGIQTIEVAKIIGSVDRYADFDRHFLPKTDFTVQRWTQLRKATLEGVELPSIQVYKVGQSYFVRDGNHRVALAKTTGQIYIDAEIIELDVSVAPEPGDTLLDLIIKGEYARFLEVTRLPSLVPGHPSILFSKPGRYDILLEHIHTRQYFKGIEEQRYIPWEEAVVDWLHSLYEPLAYEILDGGVLADFEGRTVTDLYLWIMDHRYYLSQELGRDVDSAQATIDYQRHYAPHPSFFRRLWRRIRRLAKHG